MQKMIDCRLFLPQSPLLQPHFCIRPSGCVTWHTAGSCLDAQQGEWSLPSARQEKISVSHGAQIIRSATLVEETASGSQNLFTQLIILIYCIWYKRNTDNYYTTSKQYLDSRGLTFEKNQYNCWCFQVCTLHCKLSIGASYKDFQGNIQHRW